MSKSGIKIYAPASLSLYSYGLKDLSICLNNPGNEIKAFIDNDVENVYINIYSKSKNDKSNSKEILKEMAISFLDKFDKKEGIILEISNKIPFDSGLGFLEANITATITAINNLLKMHLEKKEIFNFILKQAKRLNTDILPSHIAANLFGGIILYNEKAENPIQKLYSPHGINFTLIATKIKSEFINFPSGYWLAQSVSIATLIKGLMIDDAELMSTGINNNHFEKQISEQFDIFDDIKKISKENNVYAVGLGHLGEVIFIVNPNTLIKEQNDLAIKNYFHKKKRNLLLFNSEINLNGLYTF